MTATIVAIRSAVSVANPTLANGPIRIVGAEPVGQPHAVVRPLHAPAPAPTIDLVAEEDEQVWVELESMLAAREAAKALHPSSRHALLRLVG